MDNTNSIIMTIDLEYDWDTKNTNGLAEVPKLLDFFHSNNINATFFTVAELALKNETLIKEIAKKHEIASHSYSHANLKKLSLQGTEFEVMESKKTFKRLGIECIGFRAPFGAVKNINGLAVLLEKHGYKYDASIYNSFFPGRYFNLLKTKPYKLNNNIIEMPFPSFSLLRIPLMLSYIRLFYPLSIFFLPKHPKMFDLHPHEFLEGKPGKEIPSHIRLLSKRNHGRKAWSIFEEVMHKFIDGGNSFITCRKFLENESIPKQEKSEH